MRLSSFIHDTLYEIGLGVEIARTRAKDFIAISPSTLDGEQTNEKSYVDFDVSILVTESAETSAGGTGKIGGEIKVVSIAKILAEIGADDKKNTANSKEKTHRVSFKVPIYMSANFKNNVAMTESAKITLEKYEI